MYLVISKPVLHERKRKLPSLREINNQIHCMPQVHYDINNNKNGLTRLCICALGYNYVMTETRRPTWCMVPDGHNSP